MFSGGITNSHVFLLSRAMYSLSMDFFQIGLFRASSASFGSTMLSFSEIIKLSSWISGCALMAKWLTLMLLISWLKFCSELIWGLVSSTSIANVVISSSAAFQVLDLVIGLVILGSSLWSHNLLLLLCGNLLQHHSHSSDLVAILLNLFQLCFQHLSNFLLPLTYGFINWWNRFEGATPCLE